MLQIITIGFSAFLLFLVQPMIARMILPIFGGGSYVWLTSLLFFQVMLLAGYLSSHFIAKTWKPQKQFLYYILILLFSSIFLPLEVRDIRCLELPTACIFLILIASIGLPYFILATTTPMVQSWISEDSKSISTNPYVLFGVSNFGSLAGLLSYPVLIEPGLLIGQQSYFWSSCFACYAFLMLACSFTYTRMTKRVSSDPNSFIHETAYTKKQKVSLGEKLRWLYQSMIPAAALMVFTHHLILDIVNFPLLWVIPLSLYLISFIICFFWSDISKPRPSRTLLVILPLAIFVITLRGELNISLFWKIIASCCCLFSICMFFHGNIERQKPTSVNLTAFYLYVAIGGCLGGIFVAIISPIIFKSNFELYIVIIFSLYLIVSPYLKSRSRAILHLVQFGSAVILVVAFVNEEIMLHSYVTYKTRSFYGTYIIRELPAIQGKHVAGRILSHGTTIHGGQVLSHANKLIPISYYHDATGVGLALKKIRNARRIGVVGLGTGVVALYGKKEMSFDFFEIDQKVVDIAYEHFDNLSSSSSKIRYYVGDARLELKKIPSGSYDILIMDAFTSGSIPIHLITTEAIAEFLRVIHSDGLILYHISNQYLDLLPVLNCAAKKLGLFINYHFSSGDSFYHKSPAQWVVFSKSDASIKALTENSSQWKHPGDRTVCWSDESSNLWSVINFFH